MNKDIIQQQALDKINKHQRCGVAISMGVGKTRLAIKHLQQFDTKTIALVVIPKLSVKESWIEELKKLNLQIELEFVTYLSLNKKEPDDYDIVYLDECHNLLYKHDKFLINFNGRILGLTGTPPKNAMSEKYNMVDKYCPIVYTYTVDDATGDKILNDYKIFIHTLSLSTSLSLEKKRKDGGFWYSSESKDYNWLSNKVQEAHSQKQKQFSAIMRMRGLMEYTTKENT